MRIFKKYNYYILVFFIMIMLIPLKTKAYTLTITESEHGHVIVQSCLGTSHCQYINDFTSVPNGTLHIITSPDDGYAVDRVELRTVNGDLINALDYYSLNFPVSNTDVVLTVTFKQIKQPARIETISEDIVSSDGYCNVLKGDGTKLGDEIVCGTEHFYVLSNNGENIRLLAKHNLNVGSNIHREIIGSRENDSVSNSLYCQYLANRNGALNRYTGFYEQDGYCFYEIKYDNPTKVMQSMNYQSAHWDKDGNYLYPQAGDIYLGLNTNSRVDSNISYSDPSYFDFITDSDTPDIGPILSKYKDTLNEYNVDVLDIDLLSLSEVDDIVFKKSNKRLPLQEWGDAVKEIPTAPGPGGSTIYNSYSEFGSLLEYIPNEYNWIWGTSYWLSTGFSAPNTFYGKYYMFIASLGKLCGSGFAYCASSTEVGTGIRPVITISPDNLKYLIKTKTDGNGTIDVVDNSAGGETIQFKVTSNKGYKLHSIIIKTGSGEEIEFSEGEIIKNDDGTISIDRNNFTMPFENVTVEAKWTKELVNPKTGDTQSFVLFGIMVLLSISIFSVIYLHKEKESRLEI